MSRSFCLNSVRWDPVLRILVSAVVFAVVWSASAQQLGADAFKQLDTVLPTPTSTRLGSGAPGPGYWQQKVDYSIAVTLDESAAPKLTGHETITYHNRSPHLLTYLWVQLDQNSFAKGSDRALLDEPGDLKKFSYRKLRGTLSRRDFDGGVTLTKLSAADGTPLEHTVVKTMMRIDLPAPLQPGESFTFELGWWHPINDARAIGGRGGYEAFDDGSRIYTIAQWFPRLAVYDDVNGWQNKQFLGRGEFALELGDYDLAITAPDHHVVSATGTLENAKDVLTVTQRQRLDAAKKASKVTLIITPREAKANLKRKATGTKTWRFTAKNVRDVAFASSPRFVWDAMSVPAEEGGSESVLCMSFYPPQAAPLWTRYSTQAVAHTIEVYGRMTFPYPYPVAISVNGPVGGMEYPMISFNGPRAEKDGTYYDRSGDGKSWWRTKYGLISVVIHEVGHNWFPMIINSDERQWSWMDEGLNTFLQYVAEQEWEADYPSWRGDPKNIVEYMSGTEQVPIMTNSESILQFGNNAYGKPATALSILRESVLGRQVFDFAFKTYTQRWRFKRPMPADFFRSMEDAAGMDLDWFWRGWFYTTGRVDLGIGRVAELVLDTRNPDVDKPAKTAERKARPKPPTVVINQAENKRPMRITRFPELKDFYNERDNDAVTEAERKAYQKLLSDLEEHERKLLGVKKRFYIIELVSPGQLVMPVPLDVVWRDRSGKERTERINYPAEIWRKKTDRVRKLLVSDAELVRLEIDAGEELADTDRSNNAWPPRATPTRFKLYKETQKKNDMQKAK